MTFSLGGRSTAEGLLDTPGTALRTDLQARLCSHESRATWLASSNKPVLLRPGIAQVEVCQHLTIWTMHNV